MNCSSFHRKELTLKKFVKDCLLWKGLLAGAGEENEEEREAERCDELTSTSILCLLCHWRGEDGVTSGSKVEPGKKGGLGGGCVLRFSFISLYPDLIASKLN